MTNTVVQKEYVISLYALAVDRLGGAYHLNMRWYIKLENCQPRGLASHAVYR